jgi:hypothetical protein
VGLLFRRAADADGVRAKEGGQDASGHAQVNGSHQFGDAVDVIRAAAQPTQFLRDEKQVETQLRRVVQFLQDLFGEAVFVIELEQVLCRQLALGVLAQGIEDHLACFAV